MEVMSVQEIKEMNKNGIYYVNRCGVEKFVDFKECTENWITHQKRRGENHSIFSPKYVGQRNITGNPMFIEFFTKPFTRIEFQENDKQKFIILRDKLIEFGWETLDLS